MFKYIGEFSYSEKRIVIIYSIIVLIAAYFTYFKNYDYPPSVFWDENYHIASAQKYIEGVMFMEPHPPLGKMFMALGEYVLRPNRNVNLHNFTQTDYIKDFPPNYSFRGVRLFSSLFSWLSALLFFLIFYLLSKNAHSSLFFSSLYIFENALIVHSRSAMLEGSHLFFVLLTILYFVYLIKKETKISSPNYFILGILAGIPVSIKVNGAIVLLLFLFLFVSDEGEEFSRFRENFLLLLKRFIFKCSVFILGLALIFFSVWQIHFSLGRHIESGKTYGASEKYKAIIQEGKTSDPRYFLVMFSDNLAYMKNYDKGVPRLDVCKPGENGSYPLTWPVGNKSINYRWEKNADGVKYLYLQGNPIIWLLGLVAVILSIVLILARWMFGLEVRNKQVFYFILVFVSLYVCYMIAVLPIRRVLYLYHYFIPLVFSLILVFLMFNYLFGEKLVEHPKLAYKILILCVAIIIGTYLFYSPLTYYKRINTTQFNGRIWCHFWQLKPIE